MCMHMYIYMYMYIYIYLHTCRCCRCPEDGGSLTMTGTMEYATPEVLEGESPSEQQEIHR